MAEHVSDLSGPSSGAFTSCMLQIWYVVIYILLDTSRCYAVVGRKNLVYLVGLRIYCKMVHDPYNIKFVIIVFDITVQSLVRL